MVEQTSSNSRDFRDIEEDLVVGSANADKGGNFFKIGIYIIVALVVVFIGLLVAYSFSDDRIVVEPMGLCGDGTPYDTCSLQKPYFCSNGVLVRDAVSCGCFDGLVKDGNFCGFSNYTNESSIELKYVVGEEEGFVNFTVYYGLKDYIENLPRSLSYKQGEIPRRDDFKLIKIDDNIQRNALMPLVVEIQNKYPDSIANQARMAISIAQNIEYGEPDFMKVFGQDIRMTRFPYQVILEGAGSCEGKTELLLLLLRELGFGTAVFHYFDENHEAVGIKCPVEYSYLGSGYCFVETTVPAPIGYSTGEYLGITDGKLRSEPEFVVINDGFALPDGLDEYEDMMFLNAINVKIEKTGGMDWLEKRRYHKLRKKYKLE